MTADRSWAGSASHGPSVQQAIEEAIQAITREAVTLHAAGGPTPACMRWR